MSLEIRDKAEGQGIVNLETRSIVCDKVSVQYPAGVKAHSGQSKNVCGGTWENHIVVKEASNKLKKRGGSMAVW